MKTKKHYYKLCPVFVEQLQASVCEYLGKARHMVPADLTVHSTRLTEGRYARAGDEHIRYAEDRIVPCHLSAGMPGFQPVMGWAVSEIWLWTQLRR